MKKLTAIIEIPQGSYYKYEIDKSDGMLSVDRELNQHVPFNYGYFPSTLCEDKDPLDVFVLGDSPIYPLSKVKVTILGVLRCKDNGESDDKIIATMGNSVSGYLAGISIISSYLRSYKTGFEILSVGDAEEAMQVYKDSVELHHQTRLA
jgi:inorganic pyrophosphatase